MLNVDILKGTKSIWFVNWYHWFHQLLIRKKCHNHLYSNIHLMKTIFLASKKKRVCSNRFLIRTNSCYGIFKVYINQFRLHHLTIPARFDAVIDLFTVFPADQTVKTHPASTLPSSLVLAPPYPNRLQSYQSLPTLYPMTTVAHQPMSMIRAESSPPIPLLATIPRL